MLADRRWIRLLSVNNRPIGDVLVDGGSRCLLHVRHVADLVAVLVLVAQRCWARSCRMDLPGPTASVGTRTDYSVGPWDYSACATRHLMA
jgi:hypothetical protein